MSDVELGLLAGMRARASVAAALATLGCDRGDLARASPERPRRLDDYRRALGAELSAGWELGLPVDSPYAGSRHYRFCTTLWPGFDLLVRDHPTGFTWGPELVRATGTPIQEARSVEELVPWTILDSEVQARFGPHLEETRWEHGVDALRPDGLVLAFDYGLLQEARP